MKYIRIILIIVLAAASIGVSADKKKKMTWPTDKGYIARRTATIQAMDSVLKFSGYNPDPLMRFADVKCQEFNNDPELMRAIASGFAFNAGYVKESAIRYQKIKSLYPDDFESYSSYAAMLFDVSITVKPDGSLSRDTSQFNLAKAQIDSAKVAFPQSKAPYLWWLGRCTRYAYNEALVTSFKEEVEAYRKAFPNDNADYAAAKIMGSPDIEMNMDKFEDSKLKSDAEFERRQLAQAFYDKIDINTLSSGDLEELAYFYYQSTESQYLGSDAKATLYEKGLERSIMGIQKFPDVLNFSRFKLWHAVELLKYNQKNREYEKRDEYATQASQAADSLFAKTDSLRREDYFYAATAYQYSNRQTEAIDLYQKAMSNNLPFTKAKLLYKAKYHDCDSLTAYQNISDSYYSINEYEKSVKQLNALFDLRLGHGGKLKRTDLTDLIKIYRSWGNDTAKTQQERFAAYVAIDSLYATIQDSIDAHNELFDNLAEGYVGMYPMQRMAIRSRMNTLSDYEDRENYQLLEIAEEIYRRIDPLPEKSENEISWIGSALGTIWRDYYKAKDYKSALKYLNLEIKYDPTKKQRYKETVDYITRMAKRQRD